MTTNDFIQSLLHLNLFVGEMVNKLGWLSYVILFLIIFCETGLVVMPFLPGDSLLFAIGAITVTTPLSLPIVIISLSIAAFIGDQCNYWIGRKFSGYLLKKQWIKQPHIDKTEVFFKKHGKKTLVIARFFPIVRTFAPFVAGVGKMRYSTYLGISAFSAAFWVVSVTLCGYFFGNMPFVKNNFTIFIVVVVLATIIPSLIIAFKERKENRESLNNQDKKKSPDLSPIKNDNDNKS